MENEEIEETPRDVTKWVILGAFIVIIASIVYVLATTDSPEKTKSSLSMTCMMWERTGWASSSSTFWE